MAEEIKGMTREEIVREFDCEEAKTREFCGLRFELTCSGCPEQYNVFEGERQVGYVRLRHGELRVDVPDCGGREVLSHKFDDPLQGQFADTWQRYGWLQRAALAIHTWVQAEEIKQHGEELGLRKAQGD